jgi:hypothetical protein
MINIVSYYNTQQSNKKQGNVLYCFWYFADAPRMIDVLFSVFTLLFWEL